MRQLCFLRRGSRLSRSPVKDGLFTMAASQVAAAVIRRDRKIRKPIFIAIRFARFLF